MGVVQSAGGDALRDYNGLYQAYVESTTDPKNQRRITAKVPDVLGQTISNWARPASIIDYPMPKGSMVWIAFPNGDLRYPVYHVRNDPKHGRIIPGAGALSVDGPGAAGVTVDAKVHAKKSSGAYVAMVATAFELSSARELKTDVSLLDFDALEAVEYAPSYSWRYRPEHSEDARLHVGPMLEEVPSIAHASMTTLDSGSMLGILWEAVRKLSRRVEYLEDRIDTLTENG